MKLNVNGRERDVHVAPQESLLTVLRERLHLTGAKPGCERGECGACTVLLDDENVYSCLTLAVACAGCRVTTIEGLASGGALHPLQRAFVEHDAVQCGFCTPGQILAAWALLQREAQPTRESIVHALSGNLCRCGTYPKIMRAIQAAAAERHA
jgi:aerobic-type carbon monoxide dehydrogenase small subunit (CoxS/CutS family)